jgi:hypothetical protein
MTYEAHPSCVQPPDEEIAVWRFLDLPKFLDLRYSETLHFSRLDRFEDPYEGHATGESLTRIHLVLSKRRPSAGMGKPVAIHLSLGNAGVQSHKTPIPAVKWAKERSCLV